MAYLLCNVSLEIQEISSLLTDGVKVPKHEAFHYLQSTMQRNGGIGKDVDRRIEVVWIGYKMTSRVMCDKNIDKVEKKGLQDNCLTRYAI